MKVNEVQRSRPSSLVSRSEGELSAEEQQTLDKLQLGTEPGVYRYGQRARPSSASLEQRARWHYEQARALKDQRASHAPFHFSELGQARPPQARAPAQRPMLPVARYLPTQFYPGGEGERPALGAVAGVGSVQLQRIIPRYELSTAETRESGLGPSLELPAHASQPRSAPQAPQADEER